MLEQTPKERITETPSSLALTRREVEVFRLVSKGLANKVVAKRLGLKEGTVKVHLHNIYRKLRIPSRAKLVIIANQLDDRLE